MVADEMRSGTLEDLAQAQASGGVVWIDVLEPDEEVLSVIGQAYGLHPLALEDVLHFPQRPKIDAYPTNLFIVWGDPRLEDECTLATSEIDVFLGTGFLITAHRDPIPAIDAVCVDACGALARGADWTLHAILDRSVDDMFPIVDMVGEELDRLENELLAKVQDGQLQDLYAVKRIMLALHKVIGPERDVLRSMARHTELVSPEAYLYFQDIGDHVARISDAIDTYRDVASSVMDIYLSAISNGLNVVMKQLTVVATIFMPLTLISGVYGMNLLGGMWPPSDAWWSFPVVIGSFAFIAVGMLYVFKRRGWW
jgi:magnesium transporter